MANPNGSASKLPSYPNGHGSGRPTVYSEEIAEYICTELSKGRSLRSICAQDDVPAIETVLGWLFRKDRQLEGFAQRYANAREAQAEVWADELVDISDPPSGNETDDSVAVNRARLRVDTRKWVASKLLPHRYGDRIEHAHTGSVSVKINLAGKPGDDAKIIENGEAQAPQLPEADTGPSRD